MRAPITDKHLLEMMWERFPEIMKRSAEQPAPSQYGSPELQAMVVARAMEKNAAEQPAQQEPVAWMWVTGGKPHYVTFGGANSDTPKHWIVLPLYTSPPAQPTPEDSSVVQPAQQEPVTGCVCRWNSEGDRVVTCERHQGWLEVIAEWADRARDAEKKLKALNTSPPPQRTWVGLTDAEEIKLWRGANSDWELLKSTAAKLKEKNT